jgi:hypothetical protein
MALKHVSSALAEVRRRDHSTCRRQQEHAGPADW